MSTGAPVDTTQKPLLLRCATKLSTLTEAGAAARSVNLRLECAKAFLNWCVRNGRLRSNVLGIVPRRNEVIDRRVVRRSLTHEETDRLLAVAREQAVKNSRARGRPLWYMFALLAGLRRGDLIRLKWADVDLESAVITIRGGKAKRRVDRLPLHADLVKELRSLKRADVLPSARVFPEAVTNRTRRRDFERAGVLLESASGEVADLHALRVTFGTRLALAGAPPAIAQRLMRHSTVELTMRYYTKLGVDDLRAQGLDRLTSDCQPSSEALKLTGSG